MNRNAGTSKAAASQAKALPFAIPDWVPPSVAEEACTIWFLPREEWQPVELYDAVYSRTNLPLFHKLIRQLITHPRMRRVWGLPGGELTKRNRDASHQCLW
jgi:hypothetical protein